MIDLKWLPTAAEDLAYWKTNNVKKYNKILALCDSICIDPKSGLGKPEPLKHELSGCGVYKMSTYFRVTVLSLVGMVFVFQT
jgi:toxin YoeB